MQNMGPLYLAADNSNIKNSLTDAITELSGKHGSYVHILIETNPQEPVDSVFFVSLCDDIIINDQTWRPFAWMIWIDGKTRSADHFVVMRRIKDNIMLYDNDKLLDT